MCPCHRQVGPGPQTAGGLSPTDGQPKEGAPWSPPPKDGGTPRTGLGAWKTSWRRWHLNWGLAGLVGRTPAHVLPGLGRCVGSSEVSKAGRSRAAAGPRPFPVLPLPRLLSQAMLERTPFYHSPPHPAQLLHFSEGPQQCTLPAQSPPSPEPPTPVQAGCGLTKAPTRPGQGPTSHPGSLGDLQVHPCPRCAYNDWPCSGQLVGGGAAWEGVGRESPPPNYSAAREGKVARWGWDDTCLSWSLPTHGHPLHRPHAVIPRTLPHPIRAAHRGPEPVLPAPPRAEGDSGPGPWVRLVLSGTGPSSRAGVGPLEERLWAACNTQGCCSEPSPAAPEACTHGLWLLGWEV